MASKRCWKDWILQRVGARPNDGGGEYRSGGVENVSHAD